MNEVELQMLIDEAELAKAEPRLMAPDGIAIALMFELGLSHVWIANAPCRVRLRAKGPNGAGFDFDIECDSGGFTSAVQNISGDELRHLTGEKGEFGCGFQKLFSARWRRYCAEKRGTPHDYRD